MWDMPDNATSIALIEAFVKADKPVDAVCHAPAALINVRGKDGEYLLEGKRVTGFTNVEEESVDLTAIVPFLLEDRLRNGVASTVKPPTGSPISKWTGCS